MNRKEFLFDSLKLGLGCCAMGFSAAHTSAAEKGPAAVAPGPPTAEDPELVRLRREKDFTDNWLADLLETINTQLDEPAKIKLMEGCGRGCYRRHAFKHEVVKNAAGTPEGLVASYKAHGFGGVQLEGTDIHIRYGNVQKGCYCPVLRGKDEPTSELHCHCTKATHQSIIELALGRPVKIEILETLRRGGERCHFVAHLS